MLQPQKILFSDAVNRIDSIIKQHFRVFSEYWQSEYSDSYFLWFDNNVTLDKLDLEADNYEDPQFVGYIINGDLITSKILNYETDYGIHLIVLGNLITDYIAVGGQDIYIKGNLIVKNMFVGSYNHGTMYVKSNVTSPIAIIDDYSFVTSGEFMGKIFGWGGTIYLERNDTSIPLPYQNELDDILIDRFLGPYDNIEFEVLVKAIDNNEDVLSKYCLNYETDLISLDSVRLITQSDFLKQKGDEKVFSKHGDVFTAKFKDDIEELIIKERGQSHKYTIKNDVVNVSFKDSEKSRSFEEYKIGSNRYRRAKRLLDYNINRMKYW